MMADSPLDSLRSLDFCSSISCRSLSLFCLSWHIWHQKNWGRWLSSYAPDGCSKNVINRINHEEMMEKPTKIFLERPVFTHNPHGDQFPLYPSMYDQKTMEIWRTMEVWKYPIISIDFFVLSDRSHVSSLFFHCIKPSVRVRSTCSARFVASASFCFSFSFSSSAKKTIWLCQNSYWKWP